MTVAVLLAAAATRVFFLLNAPVAISAPVDVTVERGESPRSIAERLSSVGVVRSSTALVFLARSSGKDRDIRYGTHRFEGPLTPSEVLDELGRNPEPTLRVTIAEGSTLADAAEEMERQGVVTASAYHEAACDPELLATLPIDKGANCAEGYLFPDTYDLAPWMTPADVVRTQVKHFYEVMDELLAAAATVPANAIVPVSATETPWQNDAQARASVVAKTVILASIVEKEAKLPEERGLISSVFHNRLARGIPLQADPTVIYGLDTAGTPWDRAMLHRHLREPSPYNTYTQKGLPSGPICNPGRESLRAALQPPATSYIYFVARGDGAHRFSTTLADHNRAVAELRRQVAAAAAARAAAPLDGQVGASN